jgi:hypothetical protein
MRKRQDLGILWRVAAHRGIEDGTPLVTPSTLEPNPGVALQNLKTLWSNSEVTSLHACGPTRHAL